MFQRAAIWIISLLLLFLVGRWIGGGLTRNVPDGGVIAAGLLCVVWVGYLLWEGTQKNAEETELHKFLKKLISAAVVGFLLLALGLPH